MPVAIEVTRTVRIPPDAMTVRAVRSSGPGGQNVNKVASKVELRVDLSRISGLDATARSRLEALARRRLDASGRLLIVSQRTRDHGRNLEDARQRVARLVAISVVPPRPRRASLPTPGSRERRLRAKRRLSERKRERGSLED